MSLVDFGFEPFKFRTLAGFNSLRRDNNEVPKMAYEKAKVSTTAKVQPVYSVKAGTTSGALWKRAGKDGSEFVTASIQHQFFDDASKEWKDSSSYTARELADLQLVCAKLYEAMRLNVKGAAE